MSNSKQKQNPKNLKNHPILDCADVMMTILDALDTKSLVRCCLVSRRMKELVLSRDFLKIHNSRISHDGLILSGWESKLGSSVYIGHFDGEFAGGSRKSRISHLKLFGCIKGIVGFEVDEVEGIVPCGVEEMGVLWNPELRRYKAVTFKSRRGEQVSIITLMLESFQDEEDILIVRVVLTAFRKIEIELYSALKNVTRSYQMNIPSSLSIITQASVINSDLLCFVNQIPYLQYMLRLSVMDNPILILKFDVSGRTLREIPLPDLLELNIPDLQLELSQENKDLTFCEYKGLLGYYIFTSNSRLRVVGFDEATNRWKMMLHIELPQILDMAEVVAYRGNCMYLCRNDMLVRMDDRCDVKVLIISANYWIRRSFPYLRTLLTFPGMESIGHGNQLTIITNKIHRRLKAWSLES